MTELTNHCPDGEWPIGFVVHSLPSLVFYCWECPRLAVTARIK